MKTTSFKEVINSDNWIITSILQGKNCFRINAKTRFYKADSVNHFSRWCSKAYINKLLIGKYGKKASEFKTFIY